MKWLELNVNGLDYLLVTSMYSSYTNILHTRTYVYVWLNCISNEDNKIINITKITEK